MNHVCHYDASITALFNEAVAGLTNNGEPENVATDFAHALSHSRMFLTMIEFLNAGAAEPEAVAAQCVRIGMEMQKRTTEVANLEKMVGIKPKRRKRVLPRTHHTP